MDLASTIINTLSTQWTETNPSSNNVAYLKDEFDPKNPKFQIVVENYPIRSVWVVDGVYRVEHRCRIMIYCKLIKYDLDTVTSYRTKWFNMKQEIDRILIKNKYALDGVDNLDLPGGWDDKDTMAVGRGIKEGKFGKDFIYWYSEQIVTGIYYEKKVLST